MPVRLFACWCARATRRKSHRLLLRTSRRRGECHKGLRGSGEEKCLRVAHFRALLCDVHEDQSRVYRRMCRLSLSGWMRSVPYPFRSQMAKVEQGEVRRIVLPRTRVNSRIAPLRSHTPPSTGALLVDCSHGSRRGQADRDTIRRCD